MSSGLGLSLNNALTGLRANQRNISVLSHNIANVNTEGYSRQVVSQSAIVIDGVGSGVRIDDVVRNIDTYLQRAIIGQQSDVSRADTMDEFHERLQLLFGEPGANNSLDEYVSNFFNALQQLAETPDRTSFRVNAVEAGVTLAREISNLANEIENLRYEADRSINQAVSTVNGLIQRLDTLNIAINRAYNMNQSTADLLDQRDSMLKALAEHMDISTFFEESGRVSVLTTSGAALVDTTPHRLVYSAQGSAQNFIDGASLGQLSIAVLDNNGNPRPNPQVLISGGTSDDVTTTLRSGTLKGLQEMRDTVLPDVLDMLDMMTSRLRDEVNALHNNGSSFPGKNTLTGTREIRSNDQYSWTGSVRIAVLNSTGQPVSAQYSDELYTGVRPLTMDLSLLDSGQGAGQPTMQAIIDEINNHFRSPPVKAKLGIVNNIQLVSDTATLPPSPTSNFSFDLDIDNISRDDANIFVTGFTVLDDTAASITSVTQAAPQIALNPLNTYTTTVGSNNVFIETASALNLGPGDTIFLSPPGAAVNGLAPAQLSGYFQIVSVSGTTVEVVATGAPAAATGSVNDASGVYAQEPYDTIDAGEKRRTRDTGTFSVDLSGNLGSAYYDISLDVATVDEDGVVSQSTITYRVLNGQNNLLNDRYDNTAMTGAGQRIVPNTSQETIRAIMVDVDGNELPKVNGLYQGEIGFLSLVGGSGFSIAIDEMDSKQLGDLGTQPASQQTNRAFSHYFGLNNFFEDTLAYGTVTNLKNSAIDLAVEQSLEDNPNIVATGRLELQNQPSDPDDLPQYTYVRYVGNNSLAQELAGVVTKNVSFDAAGGLSSANLTVGGYTSEMLGAIAADAAAAAGAFKNAEVLFDGFSERANAISGVNLDEELANTITFQNAYSANARVISVVNTLFDDLVNLIG
jgi:flagellar hook-associated protein FlgK